MTYTDPRTLSPQQQRIIDALRPFFQTADELAEMLGVSRTTLKVQIFKIRERGGPSIEADAGQMSRGYRLVC